MKFESTRKHEQAVSIDMAIEAGIAPDGGLFVPDKFPIFAPAQFEGFDTLSEIGTKLLTPFFSGSSLSEELARICEEAFNFPAPLRPLDGEGHLSVLELFHGPTAAFKDFGARFLAACLTRLNRHADRPLTILVATSGDTGSAVAAAFHRQPNIRVLVLYPQGQVSPRQEHQLTCWSDNVQAFAVDGNFDACQALVKAAFADPDLRREHRLSSANSINIGRLLPQSVYHTAASLQRYREHGDRLNFIVPTGNLGNALSCVWARAFGLPIGKIVFATNANRPIPDYLDTGTWAPRASISTLASAMDVGNPSNMERLQALYPEIARMREAVRASAVTDEEIRAQIAKDFRDMREIWCPHTATARVVYERLSEAERKEPWAIVATAHPAKFDTIVEPLIERSIDVPPALSKLLELPAHATPLAPELSELRRFL